MTSPDPDRLRHVQIAVAAAIAAGRNHGSAPSTSQSVIVLGLRRRRTPGDMTLVVVPGRQVRACRKIVLFLDAVREFVFAHYFAFGHDVGVASAK